MTNATHRPSRNRPALNGGLAALAIALCCGTRATAAERIALHLSSGDPVSGELLEFDAARGVTLLRDDNGGRLSLRWDQIHQADAERILAAQGFAGDEPPPVQIEALRVTTSTGEVVGLDAGHDGDQILLRQRDNVIRVPASSVKRIETTLVDALDVEDPNRLLSERMRKTDLSDPVALYNLALYSEALTLYEQAKNTFDSVLQIDPKFPKREQILQRMKLLDVKVGEREESEMLNRVRALKAHGRFDDALALTQKFIATYPSSRQMAAAQRELKDIADRRKKSLMKSLRTDFFHFLSDELQAFAFDRNSELGASMTFAKEQAFDATIDRLAKAYGVPREEVLALWEARGDDGSPFTYSYGGGTFILGQDAKKGYGKSKDKGDDEDAKKDDGKKGEKSLEERLAEKLKEKAKEREQAAKKKKRVLAEDQIADIPPTPDEWWKGASTDERRAFLVAFMGEHTNHVKVVRLDQRECNTCHGKGSLSFFSVQRGNGPTDDQVPCPRCKTLGFDRLVSFR